jgi:hypothetical protein
MYVLAILALLDYFPLARYTDQIAAGSWLTCFLPKHNNYLTLKNTLIETLVSHTFVTKNQCSGSSNFLQDGYSISILW